MNKFKFLEKSKLSQLPRTTGIYCFKEAKEYLYIGKAINIKERVKNHFQQPSYRDNFVFGQVKKIGYIKADSEIEALVLEAKLIKKHQPKYNIVWRDDKNYFYLAWTKEKFSRIFITHQPKVNHIGPFVDGKALKQALKTLRKVFPYRTCQALPRKPCLWYQLDRCPAPCLLKTNLAEGFKQTSAVEKEYQENIKNLIKILQGKRKETLKDLKREMKNLAGKKLFEKAGKARDQIRALERVISHAKIFETAEMKPASDENWSGLQKILGKILKTKAKIERIEAYDISNIQGKEAAGSLVTFIKGKPDKNFYRRFKIKISGRPNDTAMIKECLRRRLKHQEWGQPDLILVDGGKPQLSAAKEIVKKKVPLLALAKKKNELFVKDQKKPILLKRLPREISSLILCLRDEAHRFAIAYHRKLRKETLLKR